MYQDGHHLEKNHIINTTGQVTRRLQNKPPCTRYNNCYLLSLSVSSVKLLSLGLALNHWIHCLQVGGVRH